MFYNSLRTQHLFRGLSLKEFHARSQSLPAVLWRECAKIAKKKQNLSFTTDSLVRMPLFNLTTIFEISANKKNQFVIQDSALNFILYKHPSYRIFQDGFELIYQVLFSQAYQVLLLKQFSEY